MKALTPEEKVQLQELFNESVKGLFSQGYAQARVLTDAGDACEYRGAGGMKCAIGHLIDDETAKQWQRRSWHSITCSFGMPAGLGVLCITTGQGYGTIGSHLQSCHDAASSPVAMRDNLKTFAEAYGLAFPEGC